MSLPLCTAKKWNSITRMYDKQCEEVAIGDDINFCADHELQRIVMHRTYHRTEGLNVHNAGFVEEAEDEITLRRIYTAIFFGGKMDSKHEQRIQFLRNQIDSIERDAQIARQQRQERIDFAFYLAREAGVIYDHFVEARNVIGLESVRQYSSSWAPEQQDGYDESSHPLIEYLDCASKKMRLPRRLMYNQNQ